MRKCELKVALDRPNRTYAVGETVSGRVEISIREDCECRDLSLTPVWRTSGQAKEDLDSLPALHLFAGSSFAGGQVSYPFRFTIRRGPASHDGILFGLRWCARASADVGPGKDESAEAAFVVTPETSDADREKEPSSSVNLFDRDVWQLPPVLTLGGALTFLYPGCFFAWRCFQEDVTDTLPMGIGAFFFLAAGCLCLVFALPWLLHTIKFTHLKVEIAPRRLHPGDMVACQVRLRPRSAVQIRGASVRFEVKERVKRVKEINSDSLMLGIIGTIASIALSSDRAGVDNDDDEEYITQIAWEETIHLGPVPSTPAAGEIHLQGSMRMPHNAFPSFESKSSRRRWKACVRLQLARWPDWERDVPLTVLP